MRQPVDRGPSLCLQLTRIDRGGAYPIERSPSRFRIREIGEISLHLFRLRRSLGEIGGGLFEKVSGCSETRFCRQRPPRELGLGGACLSECSFSLAQLHASCFVGFSRPLAFGPGGAGPLVGGQMLRCRGRDFVIESGKTIAMP